MYKDFPKIKFPKRRLDGSFCVEVRLRVNSPEPDVLERRITTWLDEWTETNRHWKRSEAGSTGGSVDFFEEFAGPPSNVKCKNNLLRFRLEGRPAAKKIWKDWLILRLLKELVGAFHEITALEEIVDCPHV